MRSSTRLPLVALLAIGLSGATAAAGTLEVPGQANIFGAGHALAPQPGGGGAGVLPPVWSFAAGPGQVLSFSSVTGLVSCCTSVVNWGNGPDGGIQGSGTTDITSYGGISGIVDDHLTMFMVGVFLDDGEPADPAPARLDFSPSAGGEAFATLAPQIGQVFYIGDGLTGTGTGATQRFFVPPSATRLYLGFADAADFGQPTSPPGFYDDNVGSLTASFDIAALPTPAHGRSWGRLKLQYR